MKFSLQSQTNKTHSYTIDIIAPMCQCIDWKISKFPCKHVFTIFNHVKGVSWFSLPEAYQNSAHLHSDKSPLHHENESTVAHSDGMLHTSSTQRDTSSLSRSLLDLPEKKTRNVNNFARKSCACLSALNGLT